MSNAIKIKDYQQQIKAFFYILRLGEARKIILFISLFLIFIATFLEGCSFGLLFPLLKKLVEGQEFVIWKNIPILGHIVSFLHLSNIMRSIQFLIIAIVVATLIRLALVYLSILLSLRENLRLKKNLRLTIYQHLLELGNLFFDQKRSGEIYGILTSSTYYAGECVVLFQQMVLNVSLSLVYVALLFFISWKMALLILVILPLLFFIMKIVSGKLESITKKTLRTQLEQYGLGIDVFSNIKLVKAFCTEKQEYERFRKLECSNETEVFRSEIIKRSINPLHEFAVIIAIASLFIISLLIFGYKGASLLIKLSVIILIIRRLSGAISGFNSASIQFFSSAPHIKLIISTLDKSDKPIIVGGRRQFKGLEKGVEFKNVSMSYLPQRIILRNISFNIPAGTTCALVGASGAGKTTIVELIPRFYEFQDGYIKIDGIDIREFDLRSLRQNMGIVSQDTLVLNASIYENLVYGSEGKLTEEEVINASKRARLYGFVARLPQGYNTNIGDKGVKLSGGELQRLSIARAILKDPPILILDEATSSIDSISERLIQEALYDLSIGRTVIVIAHRLSTVKHADQILVLDSGRIIEKGDIQELLEKKGKFYEYWQAQRF